MGSRSIKGRPGTRISHKKTGVLIAITVALTALVAGVIGVIGLCASWLTDLPDYTNASSFNTSRPTVLYAADKTTVLAEFQLENRQPVEMGQINPVVLEATVATEDERFYEHNGIDLFGIARAVVNNIFGGQLEGASTITQQFVRNTILADEMNDITLKRKVREAYISLKLEEQYSKDDILLMYLNTINYGSGAYGIQAAAQRYFSKNATDLTLSEAATLVGIPQSPTYNNPIDYPENCLARRNVVLDRMVSNGYITQAEADAAKAEAIVLNQTIPSSSGILAYPYFTSYVRNQLTNPNGKYAYSATEIFKGGLTIYTTLDVSMQQAADVAAANKAAQAGSVFEVAMVAIDPENGHIKAMVGGPDYEESQVNMATGEGGSGRQAGSAFKTFTLVTAIEKGINPQTMIDASTTASFPGWEVHNINFTNYGTRTIASAFEVSSNTAFARLCLSVGPSAVAETARKMGITSDLPETGSITLGVASVTPLDMADAYATLANGGTHYAPECIEQIIDSEGNVLVDNMNPVGERVLSPEVAHAAVEVMKGVITNGTGSAARLSGQVAAGKTGTTDEGKDSWFCGITPQLSVAIWLGDRSDLSVARSISGVSAASAFAEFMNAVLQGQPREEFPNASYPVYQSSYIDAQYNIGANFTAEATENPTDEDPKDEVLDPNIPGLNIGGIVIPGTRPNSSGTTNTRPNSSGSSSSGSSSSGSSGSNQNLNDLLNGYLGGQR